jgi:hypothetical protein
LKQPATNPIVLAYLGSISKYELKIILSWKRARCGAGLKQSEYLRAFLKSIDKLELVPETT